MTKSQFDARTDLFLYARVRMPDGNSKHFKMTPAEVQEAVDEIGDLLRVNGGQDVTVTGRLEAALKIADGIIHRSKSQANVVARSFRQGLAVSVEELTKQGVRRRAHGTFPAEVQLKRLEAERQHAIDRDPNIIKAREAAARSARIADLIGKMDVPGDGDAPLVRADGLSDTESRGAQPVDDGEGPFRVPLYEADSDGQPVRIDDDA